MFGILKTFDRATSLLMTCSQQVPAWPFVVGSFAFGIFALGPFFALWTPIKDDHLGRRGPPKKSELVSSACNSNIPD